MEGIDFDKLAFDFLKECRINVISQETARSEAAAGKKIYDAPVFGFASATDTLFGKLKDDVVVSRYYILPEEWLFGAKTVISFFMPFTEAVKASNTADFTYPSDEWLHARMEGQQIMSHFCSYLTEHLEQAGFLAVCPLQDSRFRSTMGLNTTAYADLQKDFASNWSERHTAYICGLGTFGLSKSFITQKGTAGRLGSIITNALITPSARPYQELYEYCSFCGACAKHCPAGAIDLKNGKNHQKCSDFLEAVKAKENPYYGCGKCQVAVPCQSAAVGKCL